MSIFDFNTAVIARRRKGTSDDPFIDIQESQQIINNKAVISEIPDEFTKVQVSGQGVTWIETTSIPTENQYKVDYNYGYVEFHSSRNNETLDFSYKGTGAYYLSAKRVFVLLDDNGNITETLNDIVDTTKIIYKPPVTNYTDLVTAYSTPNIGWRVQITSTNRIYRYNGDEWEYIEDASNITSIEVRNNNPTDDLFNGRMWLIN